MTHVLLKKKALKRKMRLTDLILVAPIMEFTNYGAPLLHRDKVPTPINKASYKLSKVDNI